MTSKPLPNSNPKQATRQIYTILSTSMLNYYEPLEVACTVPKNNSIWVRVDVVVLIRLLLRIRYTHCKRRFLSRNYYIYSPRESIASVVLIFRWGVFSGGSFIVLGKGTMKKRPPGRPCKSLNFFTTIALGSLVYHGSSS